MFYELACFFLPQLYLKAQSQWTNTESGTANKNTKSKTRAAERKFIFTSLSFLFQKLLC